ncbi:prenyltransferase/squalene oxidase repeat-containing protein [Roseiconus lacunae]|uniref:Terpene cyclase/mutase family protein n=1 Tax=Roseiconus lacunae TaxID=2605694 RepID=A0ABT7PMQ2_9BACT|nr:prenyltransferase/squalene oxidase repeat-containing protein [Roseiconus lacunae]MDM4017789.1 terpene cyclase/mutase family protein [Roseiconus lacunae]
MRELPFSRRSCCQIMAGGIVAAPSNVLGYKSLSNDRRWQRSQRWLLDQQSDDGGWHSKNYRDLEDGLGMTALVLYALSQRRTSNESEPADATRRGISFLETRLLKRLNDTSADTPLSRENYTIALLLAALRPYDEVVFAGLTQKLAIRLKQRQLKHTHDSEMSRMNAGGWGFSDSPMRDSVSQASANVSVTAYALEGLQAVGALTDVIQTAVLRFIDRCRSRERLTKSIGYFFTPNPNDPLNKAGSRRTSNGELHARAYRSATADALVCRLICLKQHQDPTTQAIFKYLCQDLREYLTQVDTKSHSVDVLRGIDFYHAASLGRVLRLNPEPQLLKLQLEYLRALESCRQDAGQYFSPYPWMRENDPLIATSFVLIASAALATP